MTPHTGQTAHLLHNQLLGQTNIVPVYFLYVKQMTTGKWQYKMTLLTKRQVRHMDVMLTRALYEGAWCIVDYTAQTTAEYVRLINAPGVRLD